MDRMVYYDSRKDRGRRRERGRERLREIGRDRERGEGEREERARDSYREEKLSNNYAHMYLQVLTNHHYKLYALIGSLTLPRSMIPVSMTMMETFFSQTIRQKSGIVSPMGPEGLYRE